MDNPVYTAGCARLDITPPLGVEIPGGWNRRVGLGVLDPLFVNAIAFGCGDRCAVLLCLDLLGLYGSFAGQLRKKITVKVPAKRMNSLEYIVSLPDKDNMKLNLMVGSPSQLFANLPVQIVINGEVVWSGTITESNTVTDISLDLSAYKGQVIFLSLQADGRSLDGATKEVVWVNPVIKSIS